MRSARSPIGRTRATKFVPQRSENRDGAAWPSQVADSCPPRLPRSLGARRRGGRAFARAGARRGAPRSSRPGHERHGSREEDEEERRQEDRGQRQALTRPRHSISAKQRRDRHPEAGSPRSNGTRRTSLGRLGISPSTSEPSRLANAKALARDHDTVGPGHSRAAAARPNRPARGRRRRACTS